MNLKRFPPLPGRDERNFTDKVSADVAFEGLFKSMHGFCARYFGCVKKSSGLSGNAEHHFLFLHLQQNLCSCKLSSIHHGS